MNATAIVLAGGRSSRMGRAKPLLPFGDRPLVAHVVASLSDLAADVVVVAGPGQQLPPLPARVVHDDVAHLGPMSGMRHGLAAAQADLCFVTSCDAPFLDPALISHLLAVSTAFDVVVARWRERLQPLHAVYRRGVLPVLEQLLASGERRPVSLFDRVRTRTIGEDEVRAFDPEGWSFFNVNTPAQYRRAIARLRSTRRCTVELFGGAGLLAKTREVRLTVAGGATLAEVVAELARRFPVLLGRVIAPDGRSLACGYACNLNGADFIRRADTPVGEGDSLLIVPADAGG